MQEEIEKIYQHGVPLILDFETTNLDKGDPWNPSNRLLLAVWKVGFGEGGYKYSFGSEYEQHQLLKDIEACDYVVAHNAKFELAWLYRCGYDLRAKPVLCTMLGQYVIAGNRKFPLSLSAVANHYGHEGKSSLVDQLIKAKVCPSEIPTDWLLEYCAKDVAVCCNTAMSILDYCSSHNLMAVLYSRCSLTPVLCDIERVGMCLDQERVDGQYRDAIAERGELRERMSEITGGINTNSNQQLTEYLFKVLKFKKPRDANNKLMQTANKATSVSKAALDRLEASNKRQREFLELRKRLNKLEGLVSKYLQKMQDCCVDNEGILRASFNQTITATHRLSSSGKVYNIQLQNVNSSLKPLFKAREEGYVIMEVDYCLAPSTKVLTHDFRYVAVETLKKGDLLVGFEEELRTRGNTQFKQGTVTAVKSLHKPCVRLNFTDGTSVTCSEDHQWVAATRSNHWCLAWVRSDALKVNDYIPQVCEVWGDEYVRPENQWMAGFLDGEGYCNASTFGVGQNVDTNHQCLWEKFLPILERDFPDGVALSPNKQSKVSRAAPYGLRTAWTMVGKYQPVRLRRTLQAAYPGTIMRSKRNKKKRIVSIETLGIQEVIAVQTDTRTFIAEGMPSHNCQLEFRIAVDLCNDTQGKKDIASGHDVHAFTATTLFDEFKGGDKALQKKLRRQAKASTFRPLFGGSSGTAREKKYFAEFLKRYKDVKRTQEGWIDEVVASRDKELVLPTGLRFFYPKAKLTNSGYVEESTRIKNAPIQSFASAEVTLGAVKLMWDALKTYDSFIVATIHDSIILEVKWNEIEQVKVLAESVMQKQVVEYLDKLYNYRLDVPLDIEIEYGAHWGE